jgi:radical SAM/Cys-rich protein
MPLNAITAPAARHEASVARNAFAQALAPRHPDGLRRGVLDTLQINLGKRCNQACRHCHVEAGPTRTEQMSDAVFDQVVKLIEAMPQIQCVDITGGAPELHPRFRELVQRARAADKAVIDRCNLTILLEVGQEDLAEFLADHHVQVTASLPCYSRDNVDAQRGRGVFEKSIEGLQRLNALGYGQADGGLELNLVYNPLGASLPPAQPALQAAYQRELLAHFDVRFNALFTITNMPIRRFLDQLARTGEVDSYMKLLVERFNADTVDSLMCRSLVSIGWDGRLYDCDFNQMLEISLGAKFGSHQPTVFQWVQALDRQAPEMLFGTPVAIAGHCFGCTAGAGSSCGGTLANT